MLIAAGMAQPLIAWLQLRLSTSEEWGILPAQHSRHQLLLPQDETGSMLSLLGRQLYFSILLCSHTVALYYHQTPLPSGDPSSAAESTGTCLNHNHSMTCYRSIKVASFHMQSFPIKANCQI